MFETQEQRPWRWPSLLLVLPLVLLSACGGGGDGSGITSPSPNLSPLPMVGSLPLTVVNGWGPASVPAASSFEAWGNVHPLSEVVTSWTGGTITSDADEWHAMVMAGSTAPMLTANKLAVSVTFETLVYRTPTTVGKTARFFTPAAPKGLILMLHGTGGIGPHSAAPAPGPHQTALVRARTPDRAAGRRCAGPAPPTDPAGDRSGCPG